MHTVRINRGRLAGRLITYQLNRKEATTGRRHPPMRESKFVAARRELAPQESYASLETRNRGTADRLYGWPPKSQRQGQCEAAYTLQIAMNGGEAVSVASPRRRKCPCRAIPRC
jgi:hypothetical protein